MTCASYNTVQYNYVARAHAAPGSKLLGMLTQNGTEAKGACSADLPAQWPYLRLSAAAQCQGDRTAVWPDYLLQVSCYFHA